MKENKNQEKSHKSIILNNLKNDNQKIKKLYNELKPYINYKCYQFSQYFSHIDMDELYSQANLIFTECLNNYTYKKYDFIKYFKKKLHYELMFFRTKKYQELRHDTKVRIFSEIYYDDNIIKIRNNEKLKVNDKTKNIINQILVFLLCPDYMNKLRPYLQIKKQKKIKPSSYIVKKYFNDVFGYSYNELEKAVQGIKLLLREEMI